MLRIILVLAVLLVGCMGGEEEERKINPGSYRFTQTVSNTGGSATMKMDQTLAPGGGLSAGIYFDARLVCEIFEGSWEHKGSQLLYYSVSQRCIDGAGGWGPPDFESLTTDEVRNVTESNFQVYMNWDPSLRETFTNLKSGWVTFNRIGD